MTVDEERAFAPLVAGLPVESSKAARQLGGRVVVVIVAVCLLATASFTASVWL